MSETKLQSVLKKLENTVDEGKYYEAQQLYKTIYFRYYSKKQYEEIIKLLFSGATKLLEHNQINEGTDLAILLFNILSESNSPVTKENLDMVIIILTLHLNLVKSKEGVSPNENLIKSAIKWSIEQGDYKEGEPELHNLLAEHFYSLADSLSSSNNNETQVLEVDRYSFFGRAQKHFLRGNRPESFAKMLIKWAQSGISRSEYDLLIARAVLQYLTLSNMKDSNIVFDLYMKQLSIPQTPLINFIRFLLVTLERDASNLFQMLRTKYKASLSRDPSFDQMIDQIGQIYFKLPPSTQSNNFLGDLMRSLFAPQ